MIHLDTSFLVDLLRERRREGPGPASALLEELLDEEPRVSVFVACELAAGIERSERSERERDDVQTLLDGLQQVAPDTRFAGAYGRAFAATRRAGDTIAAMDLLIATSALVEDARLVTRNRRYFERIPGLRLISY